FRSGAASCRSARSLDKNAPPLAKGHSPSATPQSSSAKALQWPHSRHLANRGYKSDPPPTPIRIASRQSTIPARQWRTKSATKHQSAQTSAASFPELPARTNCSDDSKEI